MVTDSSMDSIIQYVSGDMDELGPLLDEDNWGIPVTEEDLFDPATLQDIKNPGFRNDVPTATCALPSVSRLVGDYNFGAVISPDATGPDCLYSAELNKIFVNINKNVPVQFRLTPYIPGLYIRALAVYVSSNDQQVVVTRCITHVTSDKLEGREVDLVAHILRCTSTNAAAYYKDEDSGRFSVRVPVEVPQRGMNSFTVCYKFTCLNSCQQGNSRRGMGIIFTLEDEMGAVFGRHFMNIRVCSCPKRDKEKEEKKKEGKTPASKRPCKTAKENEPPKKLLKPEPGEVVVVKIPIKVCNIKELAKFARDLIYRDVGMQQRQLTDQEKSFVAMYNSIIESSEEELLQRPL